MKKYIYIIIVVLVAVSNSKAQIFKSQNQKKIEQLEGYRTIHLHAGDTVTANEYSTEIERLRKIEASTEKTSAKNVGADNSNKSLAQQNKREVGKTRNSAKEKQANTLAIDFEKKYNELYLAKLENSSSKMINDNGYYGIIRSKRSNARETVTVVIYRGSFDRQAVINGYHKKAIQVAAYTLAPGAQEDVYLLPGEYTSICYINGKLDDVDTFSPKQFIVKTEGAECHWFVIVGN